MTEAFSPDTPEALDSSPDRDHRLDSIELRQDDHRKALEECRSSIDAQKVEIAAVHRSVTEGFAQVLFLMDTDRVDAKKMREDVREIQRSLGLTVHKTDVAISDLRLVRKEAIDSGKKAMEAMRQSSDGFKRMAGVVTAFEARFKDVQEEVADLRDAAEKTGRSGVLTATKAEAALEIATKAEARASYHDLEAEKMIAAKAADAREEKAVEREIKVKKFEFKLWVVRGLLVVASGVVANEVGRYFGRPIITLPTYHAPAARRPMEHE